MVKRTVVWLYRAKRFAGQALGVSILVLIAAGFTQQATIVGIATVVSIASLFMTAMTHTCLEDEKEDCKILDGWRRLGLKISQLPRDEEERMAIASAAETMILFTRALRIAQAFEDRDKKEHVWKILKKQYATAVASEFKGENCQLCDLPKLRYAVRDTRRMANRAERVFETARLKAEWLNERYLAAWDLLTKPKSEGGTGILTDEKFRDPKTFYESAARAL